MALEDQKDIEDREAAAALEVGFAEATQDVKAPAIVEHPIDKDALAVVDPGAAAPAAIALPAVEKPRHVRVTEADYARLMAAADKTVLLEQQNSKAFGTLGQLQQVVNELKAQTPRGASIQVPKDAFADLAKDFPELATLVQAGLENALKNQMGTGPAQMPKLDPEEMRTVATTENAKEQMESLEDTFPEWRTIVGAVDITKQQPDEANPYRAWLKTKDAAYQDRINGAETAAVVERSIRRFQSEIAAKPKPAPAPRAQIQTNRFRDAVQPRGDGGQPNGSSSTAADEFLAGFNSR